MELGADFLRVPRFLLPNISQVLHIHDNPLSSGCTIGQIVGDVLSGISFTPETKLHGLSPRANYTDRATAACRRSDAKFADRGCHVVRVTDPYGRILGFLDRGRYFSIK
jgi:hypothetical protein